MFLLCTMISFATAQVESQPIKKDSFTLYLFLLDDCPICIDYTTTINNLHEEYGNEISFIGYFPNFSSKPEKIEAYKKKYGIKFQTFTDYYKENSKKWDVAVTPEVILYDHSRNSIIYKGRIDNKFVKLGRRRNVVTENDLALVLESTRTDSPIGYTYKKPVGCFINYGEMERKNKQK